MFRTKIVEKISTHILYSIIFFFKKCRYGMWKNKVESHRPHMAI